LQHAAGTARTRALTLRFPEPIEPQSPCAKFTRAACVRLRAALTTSTRSLFLSLTLLALPGCHKKTERAAPPVEKTARLPATAPKHAFDAWPTYGHDAGRTGASTESCHGPLRVLWRFTPPSKAVAMHAIATKDSVYVSGQAGDSPTVYAVSLSGKLRWSFDSHADVTRARWPDAALGRVILEDDGFFWLVPETGERVGPDWLDLWGQTLSDGQRLYVVNEQHLDGPGVFVGAFDRNVKPLWRANKYIEKRGRLDVLGAIALDGGTLFQAALFKGVALSGLFALDPANGRRRWLVPVYPASSLSAHNGRLFVVEIDWRKKTTLFARSEQDGRALWSEAVADTDHQAPVIAGRRVVTYGPTSGVVARDVKSGRTLWSAELSAPGKERPGYSTALAVALGSRTLIAASGPELAVLSLDDGRVEWKGDADSSHGDLHSPIVAGGRVYVVSRGSVLALACAH
jgi:outer membrane protein assembly factor BamB